MNTNTVQLQNDIKETSTNFEKIYKFTYLDVNGRKQQNLILASELTNTSDWEKSKQTIELKDPKEGFINPIRDAAKYEIQKILDLQEIEKGSYSVVSKNIWKLMFLFDFENIPDELKHACDNKKLEHSLKFHEVEAYFNIIIDLAKEAKKEIKKRDKYFEALEAIELFEKNKTKYCTN